MTEVGPEASEAPLSVKFRAPPHLPPPVLALWSKPLASVCHVTSGTCVLATLHRENVPEQRAV